MRSLTILVIYVVTSLVAFIAYAIDKSAARNGERRIREATLHLLALTGGWPGALIAQRLLHHKTRKLPFQVIFWITVLLNCWVLGALLYATGAGVIGASGGTLL